MVARTSSCVSSARGIPALLRSPSKPGEASWCKPPPLRSRCERLFGGESVRRRCRTEAGEERLLSRIHAGEICLLDVAETADLKGQARELDRGCMIGRRQAGQSLLDHCLVL